MAGKVKAVPAGFHSITPHMVVRGAGKAIEFYKKAFGAEVVMTMPGPDGKSIMHGELKIGDSHLMLCDEWPGSDHCKSPAQLSGTSVTLHLYVEDVDAFVAKAEKAGAKVTMPVMDAFWGDRYGKLRDPFGHEWGVATHIKDMTPEECVKAGQEWMAQMGECK